MNKYPLPRKYLAVGIILLFIGTAIIPSMAQKINETDTSILEGKPDLTIVRIVDEIYIEGLTCKCVVKNIGTAPFSGEFLLSTYGYAFFGLVQVWESHNYGHYLINPGETENIQCGCPYPYFGFIRYRCFISTSTPEENNNNNRFAHSYFLINRDPFWGFKELPW